MWPHTFTPSLSQAWLLLALAIALEVVGTVNMKLSRGLSVLWPSALMFVCYGLAFACNALATKTLDLSISYAVWSGVGTAATAVIGIWWFREAASPLKLISLVLIVAGVLGLFLASQDPSKTASKAALHPGSGGIRSQ